MIPGRVQRISNGLESPELDLDDPELGAESPEVGPDDLKLDPDNPQTGSTIRRNVGIVRR